MLLGHFLRDPFANPSESENYCEFRTARIPKSGGTAKLPIASALGESILRRATYPFPEGFGKGLRATSTTTLILACSGFCSDSTFRHPKGAERATFSGIPVPRLFHREYAVSFLQGVGARQKGQEVSLLSEFGRGQGATFTRPLGTSPPRYRPRGTRLPGYTVPSRPRPGIITRS